MGLYQTQGQLRMEIPSENNLSHEEEAVPVATTGGRIIVYGDSNCLDNSHMQKGLQCLFPYLFAIASMLNNLFKRFNSIELKSNLLNLIAGNVIRMN